MGVTRKLCARCREPKLESDFYINKGWRDGLHPYCKPCLLAWQKDAREKKVAGIRRYRWKRDLIRHDYFASIDSHVKAYVLGMLAADASITPKHKRVSLELAGKDEVLINLLRDELVPGGAITSRVRHERTYFVLAFASEQMIADLHNYGVGAAKSLTIRWPERLPSAYERAFILGVFDGDGHITHGKRQNMPYPYWGLTSGSPEFLEAICAHVEQGCGVHPGGPWNKHHRTYTIRASGLNALVIDQWLHSDDLGLARKRISQGSQ